MSDSYRQQHDEESPLPRFVAFEALSAATRERLVAACRGEGEALLLSDRTGVVSLLGPSVVLGAVGGLVALRPLLARFGDLQRGSVSLATVAAGLALLFLGAPLYLRNRRQLARLPPGLYLFARELVDARQEPMHLLPTSRLSQIREKGGQLVLRFEGGEVRELPPKILAGELAQTLSLLGERLAAASARRDLAAQLRLDPFAEERRRWPATPQEPRPSPLLRWGVLSLLAGALLAWPLARAADDRSESEGIEQAIVARDDAVLKTYIDEGGRQHDRADAARLGVAAQASDGEGFFRYLRSGGRLREQADEALYLRYKARKDPADGYRYLAVGQRHRAEVDEEIFLHALPRGHEALEAYVEARGARADEVRALHLPRIALRRAVQERDLIALAEMARDHDDAYGRPPLVPELRAEAQAALDRIYERARADLKASSGLRTPVARGLDALLAHAARGHREVAVLVENHVEDRASDQDRDSVVWLDSYLEGAVPSALSAALRPHLLRFLPGNLARKGEAPGDPQAGLPWPRVEVRYTLRFAGSGRRKVVTHASARLLFFAAANQPAIEATLPMPPLSPHHHSAWFMGVLFRDAIQDELKP